jgi:hypothetical protein
MKYTRLALFFFVLAISLATPAQRRTKGQAQPTGVKTDIKQVDFKNYTYLVNGKSIHVRKGTGAYIDRRDRDESFSADVDKIVYGDLTGDGMDEAAVVIAYRGSGSGSFNDGFVYALKNGHPQLLTTFKGGDRADGSIADVKIQSGLLVVERFAPESPGSGLCCPKYIDTTKYRWSGSGLVQVGRAQRRNAD